MSDEGGLIIEQELMRNRFWFDDSNIRNIRSTLRIHTTVDVAGMESYSRGDYTVLTTAGFDQDGRVYILEIRRGHFSPTEVINHIFDIWLSHKPLDIKIEKEAHSRVLVSFLRREMSKRQIFPNIMELKRDTRTSKIQRIKGLEPWFSSGVIRFHKDIAFKTDLVREIVEFPASKHDDILDTIADQMQNRDGGVNIDVIADGNERADPFSFNPIPQFEGFDQITGEANLLWDKAESIKENYNAMTGV
jgi:predicted phage terminase large subunit-like protein